MLKAQGTRKLLGNITEIFNSLANSLLPINASEDGIIHISLEMEFRLYYLL